MGGPTRHFWRKVVFRFLRAWCRVLVVYRAVINAGAYFAAGAAVYIPPAARFGSLEKPLFYLWRSGWHAQSVAALYITMARPYRRAFLYRLPLISLSLSRHGKSEDNLTHSANVSPPSCLPPGSADPSPGSLRVQVSGGAFAGR